MLKKRSELAQSLMDFKFSSEAELQMFKVKLTNIRLDRAGENFPKIVKEFCLANFIHLEPSPAYAPQSNGSAERLLQEQWTRARVLLFSANLTKFLWPEVISHANCLRNRPPASRINYDVPILRWNNGTRIDHQNVLEFGTPGFALIY